MADGLRKAAVWLGLMSDSPYPADGDEEATQEVGSHEQPLAPQANWGEPEQVGEGNPEASVTHIEQRRPQPVRAPADLERIITVHPRTYNEARTIGEYFRDGVPVIMNLSEMEDADAKRLVDFASGLIFGLRGTIERVTSKVFLLSPANVNVTLEDREKIVGGLFNQS